MFSMKILIDVNHPAHVHLFKNFIKVMVKKGHEITITASSKDITLELLNFYHFPYYDVGSYGKNLSSKIINLLRLDINLYKVARKVQPDLFLGVGSIRAAHVAALMKKPSFSFEDTEISDQQQILYLPFTTKVFTPTCYLRNHGPKQIRYNGYHALAHLHPNWFTPDPSVLNEVGLRQGDPFFIVRLVSWGATHDFGNSGVINISSVIDTLEKYGRVFITSEAPLEKYRSHILKLRPDRFHSLLAFSSLYLGDGGTTATEAAVLGVPSIYVSPLIGKFGVFNELEQKYGLLYQYNDLSSALNKSKDVLTGYDELYWGERREKMIKEKIDVTKLMIWFVENYPLSVSLLRDNPSIQNNFIEL